MATRIKTKKPCCSSSPRCKSCPVVLKRLEKAGHAKRIDKRSYVLISGAKGAMKTARAR